MIKLCRTHPRHLSGTSAASFDPSRRAMKPVQNGTHFGEVLMKARHRREISSPASEETHRLNQNFASDTAGKRPENTLPTHTHSKRKGESGAVSRHSIRPERFEPLIEEASLRFSLDKNLLWAVIKAESDFNPNAESRSGAVGLMQLLPSTGRELGVRNLYNPRENIMGGARYLAAMLTRYGGHLEQALAAYNWGPGNLERHPNRLPTETEEYIQRVLRFRETLTT